MQGSCKKEVPKTSRVIIFDMKRLIRSFKRKDGLVVLDYNCHNKEQMEK